MHRLAAVLAILLLAMAVAPLAQAQLGPNVPEPLTQDPAPPPAAPQKFDDDSISTLQQVLIFGAAALVLGAIAFIIVRDARRAAPVDQRPRGGSATGGGGAGAKGAAKSARERERAQRAKRQKTKAARQQRKHNRPR